MHAWVYPAAIVVADDCAADAGAGDTSCAPTQPAATSRVAATTRLNTTPRHAPCRMTPGAAPPGHAGPGLGGARPGRTLHPIKIHPPVPDRLLPKESGLCALPPLSCPSGHPLRQRSFDNTPSLPSSRTHLGAISPSPAALCGNVPQQTFRSMAASTVLKGKFPGTMAW